MTGLFRGSRAATAVLFLMVASTGCGGRYDFETIPVQGAVTLDGQPLEDALVIFRPQQGRPSSGRTDALGQYQLQYLDQKSGALPGPHRVSISTREEPDLDSDDPQKRAGRPERVPHIYNVATTLSVDVKLDMESAVNFNLESDQKGLQGTFTAR